VDIGENIGAKLQAEQADADKRVAQAKAEVRRAAAVAVEQEMRARTQEMRAAWWRRKLKYRRPWPTLSGAATWGSWTT
jgi:uncharacterized protein YqfA (UPF0365 family)